MVSPSGLPLLYGTIIFIILGTIAVVAAYCTGKMGYHKFGNLSVPLLITATICMWLMWAGAWMMQWHPLIVPEPKEEN